MKTLRTLFPAPQRDVFAALLLLVSATLAAAWAAAPAPKVVGQLRDLAGARHALSEPSTGRPTVFLFLSAECPVVNAYTSRIVALEKAYRARGVRVFGVYANANENAALVAGHARDRGFVFPVVKDDGTLAKKLGATLTPEAVVLDKAGKVCYQGRIDDNRDAARVSQRDLSGALDAVLANRPAPQARTKAFGCVLVAATPKVTSVKVTYARDIAPILNENCVACHRKGEVAPFGLDHYAQAARWASQIKTVTQTRQMPPWRANSHGQFFDERRLSDPQIATLAAWADAGAPAGDLDAAPAPPVFRAGWKLGKPDAVVAMPEEYTLGPDGKDVYQCFVIPTNYDSDKWVSAIEVQPGNRAIVHHVIAYLDKSGSARKLDAATPEPGYANPTPGNTPGFIPVGALGGWAPGNEPRFLPAGVGNKLPQGSDIVLEVHYHRDGKPEQDKTRIGVYFAKGPVEKRLQGGLVINFLLDIPPGASNHLVKATSVVPADVTLLSITPHMHVVGRAMTVVATLPDGTKRQLVDVPDWDFRWQLTYSFKTPVKLPKGTRLDLEARYDNSAANPNNPNHPPKAVRWGEQTTDEMCLAILAWTRDDERL